MPSCEMKIFNYWFLREVLFEEVKEVLLDLLLSQGFDLDSNISSDCEYQHIFGRIFADPREGIPA